MSSHLIPTPRTDKNGRIVIRHMKQDGAPSSLGSLLPVMPPAAQTSTDPYHHLLMAVYGDEDPASLPINHERAIRFMQEHNPGLDATVENLLAKNNDAGTASVRDHLRQSVLLASDALAITNEGYTVHLSYTDGFNCSFNESLVRAWAIGSVRAEATGHTSLYDMDFQDGLAGMRYLVHGDNDAKHPYCEDDADYWRGMTALYFLDFDPETEDDQLEAQRFVRYASTHGDIGSVIHVARERKTLDVNTIEGIIAQETDAPAIRDGIL